MLLKVTRKMIEEMSDYYNSNKAAVEDLEESKDFRQSIVGCFAVIF
jgi:hypothetical protein